MLASIHIIGLADIGADVDHLVISVQVRSKRSQQIVFVKRSRIARDAENVIAVIRMIQSITPAAAFDVCGEKTVGQGVNY